MANELGKSRLLAEFMDDCWEPDDANRDPAPDRSREAREDPAAGTPLCLRVVGEDVDQAEMISMDHEGDPSELPGTASYLWVLWSRSPPTREWMIARYKEFP